MKTSDTRKNTAFLDQGFYGNLSYENLQSVIDILQCSDSRHADHLMRLSAVQLQILLR